MESTPILSRRTETGTIGGMDEQPGRRERKRERTRQAIADAAMKLFLERGFDKVTVADVAEEADVSVNTVYNHFPTKEALFFAQQETSDRGLVGLVSGRRRGESVVAFFRRQVAAEIERLRAGSSELAAERRRRGLAMRQVIQASDALQVMAVHFARKVGKENEETFTRALAEDAGADPSDIKPRLVTSQLIGMLATLCLDAEQRRRAGYAQEEVIVAFSTAAETAARLLEGGIHDYGALADLAERKRANPSGIRTAKAVRRRSV